MVATDFGGMGLFKRRKDLSRAAVAATSLLLASSALVATPGVVHAARAVATVSTGQLAPLPAGAPRTISPGVASGDYSVAASSGLKLGARPAGSPSKSSFNAATSVVDPSSTTATQQVFKNADGSKTLQISATPQRFQDPVSAQWKSFDPTPVASGSGYAGRSMPPGFALGSSPTGDVATAPTPAGSVSLRHANATAVAGGIAGGGVSFPGALSGGSSIAVALTSNGFEESVAAPSVLAPSTYTEQLVVPAGVTAVSTGSGVELLDSSGAVIGTYGSGIATDAAGAEAAVTTATTGQVGSVVSVQVSVDPTWWSATTRQFPINIDPTFSGKTTDSGGIDSFVQQSSPTLAHDGQTVLKVGDGGVNTELRSLLKWNVTSLQIPGREVIEAHMNGYYNGGPSCAARQMDVYEATSAWDTNVTWNNQPSIASPSVANATFQHGFSSSCVAAWQSQDLTGAVVDWVNNAHMNYGVELRGHDATDTNAKWQLASAESGSSTAPVLSVTYDDLPSNATQATPVAAASLSSATPTLTINPGADPNGDPLTYRYLISTDPDAQAANVVATGWLPGTSYTVPSGTLQDGVTYYWTVQTFDGIYWPSAPPATRSFTVDLGLGNDGTQPTDATGGVGVNLVNGNVMLQTATPSIPTVGGAAGVQFAYNSRTQPVAGLTGAYYDFSWLGHGHDILSTDTPNLTRTDPSVNFYWGTGSPFNGISSNDFTVRWTGYVTAPTTGDYSFGAQSDDGVKINLGNAASPQLNLWQDQSMSAPAYTANTYHLVAGTPVPIQVDYYDNSGNAFMGLWVKSASLAAEIVPTSWLSTSVSPLPLGWTMSPDTSGAATYTRVVAENSSVTLFDASGATHIFTKVTNSNGTSFTPPPGETTVLTQAVDGHFTAQDETLTSSFDTSGNIQSVTSATGAGSSALSYDWEVPTGAANGTPTRLTKLFDPVSDPSSAAALLHLYYSGDPSCPTAPSGFDPAPPPGMLCAITYASTNPSNHATQQTGYYYKNKQFSAVINPGGARADFGYDTTTGLLNAVRNPLQADWAAANPTHATDLAYTTQIAYDGSGRASSVTSAQPSVAITARPAHSYNYAPPGLTNTTWVIDAGASIPNGYSHQITYDNQNRQLTSTDASAETSSVAYDTQGNLVSSIDQGGRESTTIYNAVGAPTDQYGPAPASCFGTDLRPNATCTSPPPAHTSTAYDQGFNGLVGTWWNNANSSGAPATTSIGAGTSAGGDPNASTTPVGDINDDWGSNRPTGIPTGSPMSVDFTGNITFPAAGTYQLLLSAPAHTTATGNVSLTVDDTSVESGTIGCSTGCVSAQPFVNGTAGSTHRVDISYSTIAGSEAFAALHFTWQVPGGGSYVSPSPYLTPGLGLKTSTTSDTNDTHAPAQTRSGVYTRPETEMISGSAQAPSGSDLVTSSDNGTLGDGNFFRAKSTTLPAGNQTVSTYYGNTEARANPCVTGSASVNQRGRAKLLTAPDGRVQEQVYDDAGRNVASRIQTDSAWTCSTFDDRGRPTSVTQADGTTTTSSYAVGGDPLTGSVTDAQGTISTTVDLDGDTVSATDVWSKTTTTTYDQEQRVTQTIGPDGTIGYTYDAAGRVTNESLDGKIVATPAYDTHGELASVGYPAPDATHGGNSSVAVFGRDAAGATSTVSAFGPAWALITSDAVVRSQAGQILTDTVDGASSPTSSYTYDDVGRLTKAVVPGETLTYGFGPTSGCSGGLTNPGANSDRTSYKVEPAGGGSTTYYYCYGTGDQLTSTTDPAIGSLAYDAHGNDTTIAGETHYYDAQNRHTETKKGTTDVVYRRDASGRIVERDLNGVVQAKYSFGGPTDSASAVLDASNTVVERDIPLPGGVLLTKRAAADVWSYPNLHGDLVASANSAGVKQGTTAISDPYGNPISGSGPDNSIGNYDYGYEGTAQRGTEEQAGLLPDIEMGARQYIPELGRFLSVDPVLGGSANQYDYVNQDPINGSDTAGTCSWWDAPCIFWSFVGAVNMYTQWAITTALHMFHTTTDNHRVNAARHFLISSVLTFAFGWYAARWALSWHELWPEPADPHGNACLWKDHISDMHNNYVGMNWGQSLLNSGYRSYPTQGFINEAFYLVNHGGLDLSGGSVYC
jgi:RHS repeat-associated protein